jgi:hypothetical protein
MSGDNKHKIIISFIYFCNAVLTQSFLSFGRYFSDYRIRFSIFFSIFLLAGLIIGKLNRRISFNALFFLIVIFCFCIYNLYTLNRNYMENIIEISIGSISFFIGFFLVNYCIKREIYNKATT